MTEKVFEVETNAESVKLMAKVANDFKNDWQELPEMDFLQLFRFCQTKYRREQGEQFLRPKAFFQIGGDCDDAVIFTLSHFLFSEPKNIDCFYITEVGREPEKFPHVAFSYVFQDSPFYFDPFPGVKFGEVSGQYLKYWPVKKLIEI